MNCKPLFVGRKTIGDRFNDENIFVFFSNRFFSEKEFARLFPDWSLRLLSQKHSDIIIHTTNNISQAKEADGHYTIEKNLALGVYTADCLPVLIYNRNTHTISAIHAGWRGIAQKILIKALENVSSPQDLQVWIGPHIQESSFEVGKDVAEQLVAVSYGASDVSISHTQDINKKFINLTKIAQAQIVACGVPVSQIWTSQLNTFTNENYYSFRRDGKIGRQISFIVLT